MANSNPEIAVEMSLYPLTTDFIPTIKDFIDRLNTHADLRVVTNSLSTQVFGGFEEVMQALREALGASFTSLAQRSERAVVVMKMIGPLSPA